MEITRLIINLITAIAVCMVLYVQYQYIRADWCSWEIEKILFTLETIEMELNE